MVYFNCTKCGTGLKKNQVEQHLYSCRSNQVSCIDCNKDFRGDEYKLHFKCLTESERYENKSTYVAKVDKGELKQTAWLEKIGKAVEAFKGSAKAKNLLSKLVDFANVPRKKAKFMNFMFNSFRSYGVTEALLNEIWTVIENIDKRDPVVANAPKRSLNQEKPAQLVKIEEETSPVKKLKTDESANEFEWYTLMVKACEKEPLTLKKLEKKIFKKYVKFYDNTIEDSTKFQKKFYKKLKKYSNSLKLSTINTSSGQVESLDAATLTGEKSLDTASVQVEYITSN